MEFGYRLSLQLCNFHKVVLRVLIIYAQRGQNAM